MSKSTLHNERTLLLRVAEGDEDAFCIIFDHYSKFVYSFGYKLVRSKDLAEDIVQEIFLKVWEGKDKLREIDNFGGYLNILVRNHSLNLLRKLAKKQTTDTGRLFDLSLHDYATQNILDYRDTVNLLEEVLSALPAHQRQVYKLCHLDGLKYEEAAARLGVSINTVHYHMKSALRTIREFLTKRGVVYQALLFFFLNL